MILPNLVRAAFILLKQRLLKRPGKNKKESTGMFSFFFLILRNQNWVLTDSAFEVVTSECKHASHCAPVLAGTTASWG